MAAAFHVPWFFTGLAGLLVVALYWVRTYVRATLRPKAFPPGPPVTPGLGNLLQIPVQKPYLQFQKWARQYGDVVGLKTGTGNLVVLNKPELVRELFDKRGAIYSNRPVNHVLTKHVLYEPEEKGIAILQYDNYYRRWRKTFNYIVSSAGIKRLLPLLEAEACDLCRKFLDGGQNYESRIRSWSLAVPLVVTSGSRLDDLPPEYADDFYHAQEEMLKLIIPGSAPLVDVFPVLKYVPEFLAGWKKHARVARKLMLGDAMRYLDGGRKQYKQIREEPGAVGFECLLAKIMLEQNEDRDGKTEKFTDTELAFIAQAAVGAAADTTAATLKSLMVAFAAYPEVLAKAQQEVDRVGGSDRPPRADQIGDLLYLKACLSEVIRWRPATPSALPHVLIQDDHVNEYFFPKGTVFIANAWAIHRNEDEYDRPDEFVPERFLENPYGMRASFRAQDLENSGRRPLYAFGSGRRQCPGEQFALTTALVAASKLVWAYDILPPPGGLDVSMETGYQDGTVLQPLHPEVVFRPRDERRAPAVGEDAARTEAVARELLG